MIICAVALRILCLSAQKLCRPNKIAIIILNVTNRPPLPFSAYEVIHCLRRHSVDRMAKGQHFVPIAFRLLIETKS